MSDPARFDAYFVAERDRHLAGLGDFIRTPSVGALPAHRDDLDRAADENLHGPNEFLRLENFDRGLRVYADLLHRLRDAAVTDR